MSRNRIMLTALAAAVVLGILVASIITFAAPGATLADADDPMAQIREATVKFHDVAVAEAAGYEPVGGCVEAPGLGGMGIHYLNPALVGGPLDPLQPQLLLYAPDAEGALSLVGVEYFVLALVEVDGELQPWFGEEPPAQGFATAAPSLFGTTFDGPMEGHEEGQPWHYDLHVWLFRDNPEGLFAMWHPGVTCG